MDDEALAGYSSLKEAITNAGEQSFGQQLTMPAKKDPLKTLRRIKADFLTASRQEHLDLLRNHIGESTYHRYLRSTEDFEALVMMDSTLHAKVAISEYL